MHVYDKIHKCQHKLGETLTISYSLKQIIPHIKFLGEPLTLIQLFRLSWHAYFDLKTQALANFLAKIFEKLIKLNFLTFKFFFQFSYIFFLFLFFSYFFLPSRARTHVPCACSHAPKANHFFSTYSSLLVIGFGLVSLVFFFPLGLFLLSNIMVSLLHSDFSWNTLDLAVKAWLR